MDKKTMMKIFWDAFLRSFVIMLALAIVGFGVFFFTKVKSDKNKKAEATTEQVVTTEEETTEEITTEEITTEEETTEEITTEEPTTEALEISSTDKKILVLNSTSVAGLAKGWANKLVGEGFAQAVTGNFSASTFAATKIYVSEEGMGNDLVGYFKGATIEVGKPDAGTYNLSPGASEDGVEVYIVIGTDDSTVQ